MFPSVPYSPVDVWRLSVGSSCSCSEKASAIFSGLGLSRLQSGEVGEAEPSSRVSPCRGGEAGSPERPWHGDALGAEEMGLGSVEKWGLAQVWALGL